MGKDEDQRFAWLALWARLQENDEPPSGGLAPSLLGLTAIYAAAGHLREAANRAANDIEASLIHWIELALYCAIYRAILIVLRAVLRKLCQVRQLSADAAETRATLGIAALALTWLHCAKTITTPQQQVYQELTRVHHMPVLSET